VKVLYFDPILGVSGDMILASLIDLGVDRLYLKKNLSFIGDSDLKIRRIDKNGVNACNLRFVIRKKVNEHDFLPLIKRSRLPAHIKTGAVRIVERIFEVEKKIHRRDRLHLHELADADTLLDVVGALLAVDFLKVDRVYSRPVKAGKGFIKTMEGNMPAFNFATAHLLQGFPVEFMPIAAELTTPTGAAILTAIAEPKEDLVLKKIEGIGLAGGTRDIKDYPNLLRVFRGEAEERQNGECLVIETNLDDMNPQDYEWVMDRLYRAGAREVYLTPTIMKKSRPGVLLTVLCEEGRENLLDVLFEETTTLGVRMWRTGRVILRREMVTIPTPYGKLRVKISIHKGIKKFALEYNDLLEFAKRSGRPLKDLRKEMTEYVEKRGFGIKGKKRP
jgi:uncharacterized protein (TIGR00299 family) protein